jgi:hypothetical protein
MNLDKILTAMPEPQRVAFLEVVEELKPAIVEIESRPKTTQDHYGSYLGWATSQLMVVALLAAGANRNGVLSAWKINNGGYEFL